MFFKHCTGILFGLSFKFQPSLLEFVFKIEVSDAVVCALSIATYQDGTPAIDLLAGHHRIGDLKVRGGEEAVRILKGHAAGR